MASGIGRRLRGLRERAGLTQQDVADRAGVSRSYIARLEVSGSEPSLPVLRRLAAALDIRPEELAGGSSKENPLRIVRDSFDSTQRMLAQVSRQMASIEKILSDLEENDYGGQRANPELVQQLLKELARYGIRAGVDPHDAHPAEVESLETDLALAKAEAEEEEREGKNRGRGFQRIAG
jgi:transcriptional regulator with XRE-family HTH domain